MTKSQELKMALYDYLEGKSIPQLTKEEMRIWAALMVDKDVKEIEMKRWKEYRGDINAVE